MTEESRRQAAMPQQNNDVAQLNESFNRFLRISDADTQILQHYQSHLLCNGERFAQAFYEYLFHF